MSTGRRERRSRTQELKDAGFDESYAVPFEGTWKVKCSKCVAACINGVACHESGCPNMRRGSE